MSPPPIQNTREYAAIAREYGDRRARRSQVPLMQHIDDGLNILVAIGATDAAQRAFCLHPLLQDDASYAANLPRASELTDDAHVLALTLEYRRVANAALSPRELASAADIELSPMTEVNDMLVADKVQNRRDFLSHHLGSHPRSEILDRYFALWLERLGIGHSRYLELTHIPSELFGVAGGTAAAFLWSMSATAVMGKAENAVRDVAPWIEKLARLGFLAKAVLYMTIGALATAAALRRGSTPATGSRGAMAKLLDAPFGHVLLVVIAIGLFGYAAWRITEGVMDPLRAGHDAKGLAKRARSIALGAVHVALGISAIKLAWGDLSAGNDGGNTQHWAAKALATPGGTTALWLVAGGFFGYGLHQIYCAWRAKLDKRLALGSLSASTQRLMIGASRFGIGARGVVFTTVGVLVARAARHHDPKQARGVKQALLELFSFGRGPFILVATGLVAYGIYQLINARYRRIDTV